MVDKKNKKNIVKKKAVLKSLRNGSFMDKACKAADVAVSTVWLWRKDDEGFDEDIQSTIDGRTQIVEDALYINALKKNVTAQIFWLKNRGRGKWKDRYAQEFGDIKVTWEIIDSKKDKKKSEKDK